MLVNISYSVDFQEIPGVVRKLLEKDVQQDLSSDVLGAIENSITFLEEGKENIGKTIHLIEEARELLIKVDMRLYDCSNILRGYQKELLTPAEEAKEETNMEELQAKLSQLRETLGEDENELEDR